MLLFKIFMNEKSHAILMKTEVLTKSDYVMINMKYCFSKVLINKENNNLKNCLISSWIGSLDQITCLQNSYLGHSFKKCLETKKRLFFGKLRQVVPSCTKTFLQKSVIGQRSVRK